jgi:hypothetical protein
MNNAGSICFPQKKGRGKDIVNISKNWKNEDYDTI